MKYKSLAIVLALVLALTVLPYVYAAAAAGPGNTFGGFLLNPIDGNSYLAKMHEGWDGSWIFTLPYTPDPGNGGYLFLFYIFLGHLARWFNLPLIWTFHAARVAAACFLTVTLYVFCRRIFPDNRKWAERSFYWLAIGSGLGWLLFPLGVLTTDLWVPEGFPFLSEYVNPHFPLGLALLLWVFLWSRQQDGRGRILTFLAGAALAIVQPFTVAIGLAVLGMMAVWQWVTERKIAWQSLVIFGVGAGPLVAYQYWITTTDPVLAGWNSQNLTPSPAIWDLLISFSPAILAAGLVLIGFRKWKPNYYQKLAAVWFVCSLALILFPFSLQRRFLTGFYIPAVLLAGIGIALLSSLKQQRQIFTLAYAASIPTLLVILALGLFGVVNQDGRFYLKSGEPEALAWLAENTPPDSVVLASPESGNFIPAYTSNRVLYGHPFETVDAAAQQAEVIHLLNGSMVDSAEQTLLHQLHVKFVFYGPRERQIGAPGFIGQLTPVFQYSDVIVYAVE